MTIATIITLVKPPATAAVPRAATNGPTVMTAASRATTIR
jgi:hypothetical protein